MNKYEISERLRAIAECAGDAERAHSMEDKLYIDFVKFIASNKNPFTDMAELILTSEYINFSRWCA
jgi:hypothetical protein